MAAMGGFGIGGAVAAVVSLMLAGVVLHDGMRSPEARLQAAPAVAAAPVPELGEQMNSMARRFAMLWFAGQHGNRDLARYELHEMEEIIEGIAAVPRQKNGVDVPALVTVLGKSHLPQLEAAVDSGDQGRFEQAYRATMAACNSCHTAAGYGFIQIQIPTAPPVTNRAW